MKHPQTARDFFLHLLSAVTLYVSVAGLFMVIFQVINYFLPDKGAAGMDYYYSIEGARTITRTGLAMLIVAFPVYAWSVLYINKLLKKDETVREFKVRKWLMYFTVFAAAIIIIVTLISLVWWLLNGELTVRAMAKIGSVLLVSAGIFWYYLRDVQTDGEIDFSQKMVMIATPALVLLVVGFGFAMLGSPKAQRMRNFDTRRVQDLQSIYWNIQNNYYNANTGLVPAEDATTTQKMLAGYKDPETGAPYTYKKTGDRSIELCATFAVDTTKDVEMNNARPEYMNGLDMAPTDFHPAGFYCYESEFSPVPEQK